MPARAVKIVTASQMAALEQASARQGVSTDALMEKAGLEVAAAARQDLGRVAGAQVLVLVGPGNNGADGLVAARHLRRWGAEVTCYIVASRPDPDPKLELARSYGVTVVRGDDFPDLARLDGALAPCALVVDAILGTGRSRPLEGRVREIALRVNSRMGRANPAKILALDLPTGVNTDTGEADSAAIAADLTVALGFPKTGHFTFPGAAKVGRLLVADIGLPPGMEEEAQVPLELLTGDWAACHLPARPLNSHKGTFGHALVVAGSRHYPGAAYLAAQAAVRVGAGLVTLASPESVYPIAASKLTEAIHLPLPEDEEGRIHPDAAQVIQDSLSRYDAMLVGCGMGWSEGTTRFLERLLLQDSPPDIPTLVDADGLNNLSRIADWPELARTPLVLTPHPGEMATLTGQSVPEVQRDRVKTALDWAARWRAALVLKGAYTVVAGTAGTAMLSPFANPGLASGGTGDVLSGIIVGLMAQGLSPALAAGCGVYLHGETGLALGRDLGNAGVIASDLLVSLPRTIHELRRKNLSGG